MTTYERTRPERGGKVLGGELCQGAGTMDPSTFGVCFKSSLQGWTWDT
jgi:hypothetical protein